MFMGKVLLDGEHPFTYNEWMERTKRYKQQLEDFYIDHKRLPTYAEMQKIFGFQSKNAVFKVVRKLIDDGFIAKDQAGKLVPWSLFGSVKLLGLVEAGFPSAAEEELIDTMSLDEYLIKNREASYLLKVKGDSMIEAGICEGDMVIAERTNNPKVGSIVIAEVDGGWTIKFLRKKGEQFYLEPANKNYKPIYPVEELKVAAIVKAVIRKY